GRGGRGATGESARPLDQVLDAGGELAARVTVPTAPAVVDGGEQLDAWELARRVEASAVSAATLDRLEQAVDDLAVVYATTPPHELLPVVGRHLAYVGRLIEARKPRDQHHRLLVAGGWLALLRATVHIDLRHCAAADAHLVTAAQLAAHTGHDGIAAWCLETRAWDAVTGGDYRKAVELSRQAQAAAPRDGSAHIQATAQEGRAWARMGDRAQTSRVLDQVERLVAGLPIPDRPEHHYRYDPDKALSYTATTLAWAGDPAAVRFAQAVVADLDPAGDGGP